MTVLSRYVDMGILSGIAAIWLLLTICVFAVGSRGERWAWWARASLFMWGAAFVTVTLGVHRGVMIDGDTKRWDLMPFRSVLELFSNEGTTSTAILQVVGNIAMFTVFGFLVYWAWNRLSFWWTTLSAAVVGVFAELLQYVLNRGVATLDDVMTYVVGCMIGYGVARMAKVLTTRTIPGSTKPMEGVIDAPTVTPDNRVSS